MPSTFEKLCEHARETALMSSVLELLEWDERTLMPPAAGAYRADQITYFSGQVHARRTDARIGDWLAELVDSELANDPHNDAGATIRIMKREFDKLSNVPQTLVEAISRASVLGQQAWVEARKNDDFAMLAGLLGEIVALKREQAEAVGYDESPYDVLLDDYEPGETTANVARILEELRQQLVPLVAAIADSGRRPKLEILHREYAIAGQESFGRHAAAAIGFDFQQGRLDVTEHPFCSGMGPKDCRITTRYDEHFFSMAFFGTLHEAGHAIYDQGLRSDQYGLPPGSYISLGIHESQSRMWENLVGRSQAFWQHFFPQAQKVFPQSLQDVELDDFYFAINDVRPSLIRIESDEATYNLHIIIRFELEQALINGELTVTDLPGAWREKYQHYLGIEPPNDADGVLQDVHWSAALIGYFPTYSLGNLYAAQFFATADSELGGLDVLFAKGEFGPLKDWLREHIHNSGQCLSANELVESVTGKPLGHEALLSQLRSKYAPLYGLK
jgi:carboxypeptidase Taq